MPAGGGAARAEQLATLTRAAASPARLRRARALLEAARDELGDADPDDFARAPDRGGRARVTSSARRVPAELRAETARVDLARASTPGSGRAPTPTSRAFLPHLERVIELQAPLRRVLRVRAPLRPAARRLRAGDDDRRAASRSSPASSRARPAAGRDRSERRRARRLLPLRGLRCRGAGAVRTGAGRAAAARAGLVAPGPDRASVRDRRSRSPTFGSRPASSPGSSAARSAR